MNKTTDGENKKQLYQDAIYWHLIGKGYPEWKAKAEAERILEGEE